MKIIIRKNKATFLALFVANLFIAAISSFILPERFFYDALTIVLDKYNEIGFFGSYPFSMLFYKITALRYLPFFIVAIIQYPIIIHILYKIGLPSDFHIFNAKNLLVYLGFTMMAIFIGMPSKEFITFLYVALVPYVFNSDKIRTRYKITLALLLLALFGTFFRPYFIILPILSVGMYLVSLINFKNKTFMSVFYGLLIIIFLSLSHGLIKGQYFSESSREGLNSERSVAQDANSMIVSPVKTDTWYGESIGIVYGFFSVNIPLEGFKHIFSPQIIAFIIWQLALFYILLVRFSRCINNRIKYDFQFWTLLILFSFFIVQGVFEPDLGSAIRHKIGIFPLIYYVLYYDHFRKELR